MEINVEMLQSNVIPQITQAKSILGECKVLISSISIPNDFPEGSKIKAAKGKISTIEQLLTAAGTSVNQSINKFTATQTKNNALIDALFSKMLGGSPVTKTKTKKGKSDNIKRALHPQGSFPTYSL